MDSEQKSTKHRKANAKDTKAKEEAVQEVVEEITNVVTKSSQEDSKPGSQEDSKPGSQEDSKPGSQEDSKPSSQEKAAHEVVDTVAQDAVGESLQVAIEQEEKALEAVKAAIADDTVRKAIEASDEATRKAIDIVHDKVVEAAIDTIHEKAEVAVYAATDQVMEETMEEVMDENDIERSQMSSGSEDEDVAQARKFTLQRMQTVMTKPCDIQDPNKPRIAQDEDKKLMEAQMRSLRDKAILQSMAVAERGYITRLRPVSAPTDKLTLSQYQIRPGLEEKFKSMVVKEMIHTVLNDELGGKVYSEEDAKEWSQSIANTIRLKVKEMGFPRYKFVVQCVIGEEHGAGVKIGSRCLWDADTDNYASDTFLNETIFCMTAVYAIYFY